MSGVYAKKTCPSCGIEHRKRGKFCSLSCSSKRDHKEKTKEKIAESMRDYYLTPEGVAQAKVNNRRVNAVKADEEPPVTIEDFAVNIPDLPPDLSDFDDYSKAEKW